MGFMAAGIRTEIIRYYLEQCGFSVSVTKFVNDKAEMEMWSFILCALNNFPVCFVNKKQIR